MMIRDWKTSIVTLVVVAGGIALGATGALAQGTAAPKKDAPKAAPKAAAPAAGGAQAEAPSWVKLCEKAPFVGKDKDGKEVKSDKSICLTHHERLDANSGMVLVSAAVRDIEGAEKKHMMVMLPLGMALPPGMQAGVYSKDMWEKIQKGEKVDDSKLTPIKLLYTLCHSAGCTAETEATPELLKEIEGGSGMIIYAVNGNGQPIAFPIPLNGFSTAMKGPAADNEAYGKQRREMLQQIAENQRKLVDEYRKQNEELQKVAPGGKGQAPAAAPAAPAAAPAAKKP
jgi:invasion protein IalB